MAGGLSKPLISAIRSGYDAFAQMQRLRMNLDGPVVNYSRRVMSEQAYSRLDGPLGENRDLHIEIVWKLVNGVLGLHELGVESGDASRAFAEWYRSNFVNVKVLQQNRSIMFTALSQQPEAFGDALQEALQTFLSGYFELAAAFLDTIVQVIRLQDGDAFTPGQETCIGDTIRLLAEPYQNPSHFLAWKGEATQCLADARYHLEPQAGDTNLSSQLRGLCLDILVMISGDDVKVRESCNLLEMDAVGMTCALTSIVFPFSALSTVNVVFSSAMTTTTVQGDWFVPVVGALLECQSVADIIPVMKLVQTTVTAAFPLGDEDDTTSEAGMRRFCAAYMAAHVADICTPSILPAPPLTTYLFTRNELVLSYCEYFVSHPFLWNIALMYLVYSPLINPQDIVRALKLGAIPHALQDKAVQSQLERLHTMYLDPNRPFQRHLRAVMRALVDSAKTLDDWFQCLDNLVATVMTSFQQSLIQRRWQEGKASEAVWEAVESNQTNYVQQMIKEALLSQDALSCDTLLTVGEGVQNGMIPLEGCTNAPLATMLRILAALTDISVEAPDATVGAAVGSSSAGTQEFKISVPLEQRLASIEYILNNGEPFFHGKTLLRILRGSLGLITSLPSNYDRSAIVAHLILLNVVLAKLSCRLKSNSLRAATERLDGEEIQSMRLEIITRIAMAQ